jgi:hypothetical protein
MIGDLGLEPAAIALGDAVPEHGAEFVRPTDAAVQVQQAFGHTIERGASTEDEIRAVLDLAAEQPVHAIGDAVRITAGVERNQLTQPVLDGHFEIRRAQAIGEALQLFGISTADDGVGGLAETHTCLIESACEPFVLVDAHPRVEGKVRGDAQEHASPLLVAQIEVVLPDEARDDLDAIATARRGIADGDPSVLTTLEDDRDTALRAEAAVVRLDPVLAPHTLGWLDHGHVLLCGETAHEAVIVVRDLTQVGPGDRGHVPVLVEEAHDHGRLLHRLNDGVQQHTIEARVLKADALLVVLDERVHGGPPYVWVGHFPS